MATIIYRLLVFYKQGDVSLHGHKQPPFSSIFTAFLRRDAVETLVSLSSGSSEDEEGIEYLHDDPLAPIYRRGLRRGLATKKVVDILFNPRRECVARAVPTAVPINSVFVVDISAPHVTETL